MKRAEVISLNQKKVSIARSHKGYGFSYFAVRDFKRGEIVISGHGRVIDHQTSHLSVQIRRDMHYLPTKWTGSYWNHSCDPNTFARTRDDGFPDLIALRDIKREEEINYGYWMTEYSWNKDADEMKVSCLCGTKECRGKICSFSDLPRKDQEMVKKNKLCSAYLFTAPWSE